MKKNKLPSNMLQMTRVASQIILFIFLPMLYINAFHGLKELYLAVINGGFDFEKTFTAIIEVIIIVPVTILIGRFFCGWMCVFGALGDFIYSLSGKIFKNKFSISDKVDRILKFTKYGVLVFIAIAIWTLGLDVFSTYSPWDVFGMIATVGKEPAIGYVATNLTIGFILFLFIFVGSIFVERFFCRYLCPLGAFFALTSKFKFVKIQKIKDKCGNCKVCTKNCAMGISLYKEDVVNSGECIGCLKCVSSCPRKNANVIVVRKQVQPFIVSTAAVLIIVLTYYSFSSVFAQKTGIDTSIDLSTNSVYTSSESASTGATSSAISSAQAVSSKTTSAIAVSSATTKKYKDGTYQGSASGFRGATTTVEITIKSNVITKINVVSYGDDYEWFLRALTYIKQDILSTQSTDVDTVSGATFSSRGIINAVANALTKAKV